MKHYGKYNFQKHLLTNKKCQKPIQQSLQLLFYEDRKLTAGASVLVGCDVGRDGVDQGLARDDLRYEAQVKGTHS